MWKMMLNIDGESEKTVCGEPVIQLYFLLSSHDSAEPVESKIYSLIRVGWSHNQESAWPIFMIYMYDISQL